MSLGKILVAVTGSIASYKAATLVRLLVKNGYEVRVLMTKSAQDFVTPLLFQTLSKSEVFADINDNQAWNNHVELGLWADLMVVAPCTANTLAKLAGGLCDNIVTACYLSARCPVMVAPAMDLDMWTHPSTQRNLNQLVADGVQVIQPEYGELASGLVGTGRMPEPEHLYNVIKEALIAPSAVWLGKKVMITAGPTFEAIDPVRFIGNRSSGKMGLALADRLAQLGAKVTLVCGPVTQTCQNPKVQLISVQSAEDMYKACLSVFPDCDLAIMAAAVADYTPQQVSDVKIKKKDEVFNLPLVRTKDIAFHLGQLKQKGQIIIGFALETHQELENAQEKLKKKNFDLVVLNSLNDKGAGFSHDTNKITIITPDLPPISYPLKSKDEVAADIISFAERFFSKNNK
jgi:phosphopantothenoylcysteine decarboxylase/phosphopantothenate--cysteine ligase